MPYIGRPLNAGNLAVQSGTGDGSDTTPIATLDYSVGSSNSIGVYLDGVRQLAGTDFTASGTVLTFTTAPANGVGVDVYFLGLELSIPTPADATVTAAKLASNAVTSVKIIDDAVTLAKMAPGTDGNIISYDASGNPVAIATGSDGQVLTSAGAGAPPTMKAASHSLVASSTVSGSDVTSFSITGLDLDAHISYFMELELKGAENNFVSIFANNLQTATDYYQQNNYAIGTSSAGEVANGARITYTHPDLFTLSTIDISYVTGRYFAAIANNHRQTASTTFASEIQCVRKTVELAANLTRLDIVHNGSGGIAVGSKMRLYKRV